MEGDLSDGELPDDRIDPPSRDDPPAADPALVRRGRASLTPRTAGDHEQDPVAATVSWYAERALRDLFIQLCLCDRYYVVLLYVLTYLGPFRS